MHHSQISTFLLPLLLAASPASANLRCENVRVDGHSFDLSKLGGPHSVVTSKFDGDTSPPVQTNTTYTIDICKPLKKKGGKAGSECPNGTRVCGIQRTLKGEMDEITDIFAIAGNLENQGGTQFDFKATRLKTSDSTSDAKKEGVRIVLMGGKHPLTGTPSERRPQKAIIEFLCDPEKTGKEGEWSSEDTYEKRSMLGAREDKESGDDKEGDKPKDDKEKDDKEKDDKEKDDKEKDDKEKDDKEKDGKDGKDGDDEEGGKSSVEHQLKKEDTALIWESYESEKNDDVLRLTWHTEYACEKREDSGGDDDEDSGKSKSWGFFTWFILIAFLGIASYLVFSSYINYVRYGARGWDLLPHADTIRDVPYLLKDWIRRVLNTVQGTGSRGGYSAV